MCSNIIISYVSHEVGWGIINILISEAQTHHRAAITDRRKNSDLFELFIAKSWMPWTVCVYGWWGNLLLDSYFQKLEPTPIAELVKNLPALQIPGSGRSTWGGNGNPLLAWEFLLGKSHERRSLESSSHRVAKSQTRLSMRMNKWKWNVFPTLEMGDFSKKREFREIIISWRIKILIKLFLEY